MKTPLALVLPLVLAACSSGALIGEVRRLPVAESRTYAATPDEVGGALVSSSSLYAFPDGWCRFRVGQTWEPTRLEVERRAESLFHSSILDLWTAEKVPGGTRVDVRSHHGWTCPMSRGWDVLDARFGAAK